MKKELIIPVVAKCSLTWSRLIIGVSFNNIVEIYRNKTELNFPQTANITVYRKS